MNEIKKEEVIARYLLEAEAVFLQPKDPFTWASGIKSPIYCDNRQLISHVEARNFVSSAFADLIKKNFKDAVVIAGTSTAGIPWAAWVAQILNKPMVYVRSAKKDHGRENLVEGKINKGDKVVVIEDLISTGGSSMKVVEALRAEEVEVLGLIAIFSYEFKKAQTLFSEQNVPVSTLSNFSSLLKVAVEKGTIEANEVNDILNWKSQF